MHITLPPWYDILVDRTIRTQTEHGIRFRGRPAANGGFSSLSGRGRAEQSNGRADRRLVSVTSLIRRPSSTVMVASSRSPPISIAASSRGIGPAPAARISGPHEGEGGRPFLIHPSGSHRGRAGRLGWSVIVASIASSC
jgi:hypothetical protein